MIIQLIPAFQELWEVSAGPNGEVVFTKVVCIALAEHNETRQRVVCPMIAGAHIHIADVNPEHVGYATSEAPLPWVEKCEQRRLKLNGAEVEAAKKKGPQIIVPDKRVVTPAEIVN